MCLVPPPLLVLVELLMTDPGGQPGPTSAKVRQLAGYLLNAADELDRLTD